MCKWGIHNTKLVIKDIPINNTSDIDKRNILSINTPYKYIVITLKKSNNITSDFV